MPFTFKNAQKAVAVFSLIGIFMLLAVVILVGKGSDIFTFKDSYFTEYDEGYGMTSGLVIKYKGINIGKIKSMKLNPTNDKIRMEIWINAEHRNLIRQDSVLKAQAGLLGGANLILLPSIDKNSQMLVPGSMIYSSDMEKGQEIMLKLAEMNPNKEDLTAKAKDLLDNVSDLMPVINKTMLNLRDSTGSLKEMMASLNGGGPRTKVSDMLDTANSSLKNLKTISEKFKDTPDDVKRLAAMLNDNLVELKKTLVNVNKILGSEKETDKNIKSGGRN